MKDTEKEERLSHLRKFAKPQWWLERFAGFSKEDFKFIEQIQQGGNPMASFSPQEQMFQSVDYNNVEAIQALLRHYHDFKAQGHEDTNEELICIYIDIDNALAKIKTTERQMEALTLYMEGWTEEEIGAKMGGITHQAVHKLVMKVCEKVSKLLGGNGS